MGQKVHPYGFRLGVTKTWRSRWFAKQDYSKLLHEDLELKESLQNRLKAAGVSSIEVDRPGNKLRITIRTSRPGIIIGRKGAEIEKLKGELAKKTKREVFIDIQEVHRPELDAQLVSESIASAARKARGVPPRHAKAVDSALRFGCKGIKVRVSGRLNGAEIARSEWYLQGQLPLHTLRADIDYGFSRSLYDLRRDRRQVWIYKGEVIEAVTAARNSLRNEGSLAAAAATTADRGDRGATAIEIADRRGDSAARHRQPPAGARADAAGSAGRSAEAGGVRSGDSAAICSTVTPSWKQEAPDELRSRAQPTARQLELKRRQPRNERAERVGASRYR